MDGVIATYADDGDTITKSCHDLLGLIIENTGAKLVITSSWRMATLQETIEHFREKGFGYCEHIIGQTVRGYHYIQKGFPMAIPRGVEIKHWLDNYVHRRLSEGPVDRKTLGEDFTYVILDDDKDMLLEHAPYFRHCDSEIGLTMFDTIMAIDILNGTEGNALGINLH